MGPDKLYTVFLSSTFTDLRDERQEVLQAILELDLVPCGMELFPAADEDQWTLIKSVIEKCDYYVVIVAGRYGSVAPDGLGYTQKEYEFAVQLGKPVLAFLHDAPGTLTADKTEQDPEGKKKLETFREICKKRVCKMYTSAKDLGSKVSRSLVKTIRDHPAVGWVRGDLVPDERTAETILKLREELEALRSRAARRGRAVAVTTDLAQGSDPCTLRCMVVWRAAGTQDVSQEQIETEELTWNDIFRVVAPRLVGGGLESAISQAVIARLTARLRKLQPYKDRQSFSISSLTRQTIDLILIQFQALGLIRLAGMRTEVRGLRTAARKVPVYRLTAEGNEQMLRLLAAKKKTEPSGEVPETNDSTSGATDSTTSVAEGKPA